MTTKNRKTLNGVNGTANLSSRVAPGGRVSRQQGTFDRQPVTACNIREKTRIATWNVRTMNQPGKLECITREASRLKLDVLGLSEVRWKNSGRCATEDHVMIYSGHMTEHKNGVGVLLSKQVAKSMMGYHALSDRVLIVKIASKPFNLVIVQVYAPTSASSDEDIEKFYDDLDAAYKLSGSQDTKIVMGDLNAKVGTEQDPLREVVGRHGLGSRNERGDMWVDWCMTHDQVITNTWFQHHKRHLYTWKSPGDGVRNQIDYITINKRFRNSILQVKGYPGADGGSDHVPIVATLRMKLRKLKQKKSGDKLETQLLRTDEKYREQYQQRIAKQLNDIYANDQLEERYDRFVSILSTSAQETLPKVDVKPKQKWMTKDILAKMDTRRKAKQNTDAYNQLDEEIKRECHAAKERMLTEQCDLIEQLDTAHKYHQTHAQIRKVTGRKNNAGVSTCIEDRDGNIIMEQDKILERWQEYISKLYDDDARGGIPQISNDTELSPIMRTEIEYALKGMPLMKAPGPDDISTEMLVAAGERGVTELTNLANMMYREGCFPEQMKTSIFITIPKVNGTAKCEKHRTISLMSHVTKLVLRVIMNRIRGRTLREISEVQYGFMPDRGTRNAIFVLRRLVERMIEKQKDVYVCFIDYSKAFDTVKHEPLIELLQSLDIDPQDVKLLANLYWDQQAVVRHNGELSESISIKQGVRQGCVASPHLFALYTEMIMRSIDDMGGIKIGGNVINNLRYADDTVIIAESGNQLQQLMDTVVEESEAKGLFLNSAKSFTMVFSKSEMRPTCKITVHGNPLEQVDRFVYLGSVFTSDGRCEQDIRQRVAIAKSAFTSLEKILKNRNINIQLRCRLLKCYVWSTLLYGSEAWTVSTKMWNKLEATEMWFLRKMQRISYTEHVTNVEVLRRAHTTRKLMNEMVNRQVKFYGHVMRKDKIENLVSTGYVEGKRARGRQRETHLTYLQKMKEKTPIELIHLTRDRGVWSELSK